jgi:hypothetical protein
MNSLAPTAISSISSARNDSPGLPHWHQDCLLMLPKIENHARFALRQLKPDNREEGFRKSFAIAAWRLPAGSNRGGQRLRLGVRWQNMPWLRFTMAGE